MIAGALILTGLLSYEFGSEPWSIVVRMIVGGAIFIMMTLIAQISDNGGFIPEHPVVYYLN